MTAPLPKLKYSPSEKALLDILSNRKSRITSDELAKLYYAKRQRLRKKMPPYHARIIINSTLRSLMEKTKANRDVKIQRSDVRPFEYWLAS